MKIFVVHYKKMVDRKLHLLQQFKKYNITDYEFIDIDRDELTQYDISMFQENYSNSQIAVSLSHLHAYKEIRDKYDCGLIFEDDIILSDNFINIFNKYMSQLPETYDMLFIGNGCNLHIENDKLKSSQFIYKKCNELTRWGGGGSTRCTDSYLVNKKCALKICDYMNNLPYKINLPIDWFLNTVARSNNFEVYWAEPTIVSQGSQNGLFETSVI